MFKFTIVLVAIAVGWVSCGPVDNKVALSTPSPLTTANTTLENTRNVTDTKNATQVSELTKNATQVLQSAQNSSVAAVFENVKNELYSLQAQLTDHKLNKDKEQALKKLIAYGKTRIEYLIRIEKNLTSSASVLTKTTSVSEWFTNEAQKLSDMVKDIYNALVNLCKS